MTRPLPLALIALLFMWLAANFSTTWMWVLSVLAIAGLVALIVAMRFRDMYVGPRTLVDDARLLGRRIARDKGGEVDKAEEARDRAGIDDDADLFEEDHSAEDLRISDELRK